jgi:hypothetical protein
MAVDLVEQGFQAMRQVRLDCEAVLREANEAGLVQLSTSTVPPRTRSETYETPSGLEIVKTGDLMEVTADFEDTEHGRTFDVTYELELPEHLSDWPRVHRYIIDARNGQRDKEMPRRKFYEIAGLFRGLLAAAELVS